VIDRKASFSAVISRTKHTMAFLFGELMTLSLIRLTHIVVLVDNLDGMLHSFKNSFDHMTYISCYIINIK
jgi:hypothetical protein